MNQEPISCSCPQCGKRYRVPGELLGKKISCKGCQYTFVVQVAKPVPAAAGPPATAAAPAASPNGSALARAAPAVTPSPMPAAGTVAVASASPAAVLHPPQELAPIPFDDAALPRTGDGSGLPPDQSISSRAKAMEKVKIETSGPYFVVKLVLSGKMVHVGIEKALNEHAGDGWRLQQIVESNNEAYAILYREPERRPT